MRVRPVFELIEDVVMRDEYAPENVAKLTDIPAETIRKLALDFATQRPSSIIIGMGVNHRLHGDLDLSCLACLLNF